MNHPRSSHSRGVLLFGSRGQIGRSVTNRVPPEKLYKILWSDVFDGDALMSKQDLEKLISKKADLSESIDVIVASGLTQSRAYPYQHQRSHFILPKMISEIFEKIPTARILTLGSVQETQPELCKHNSYLESKLSWAKYVESLSEKSIWKERICHVRLHTVYSEDPPPHMFLGQMAAALMKDQLFEMSSGDQLREYQYREDVVDGIFRLLNQGFDQPIVEFGGNAPVSLREIAESVFEAFGKKNLLKIGTLTAPVGETNAWKYQQTNSYYQSPKSSTQGIVQVLKKCIQQNK